MYADFSKNPGMPNPTFKPEGYVLEIEMSNVQFFDTAV
jgi:hypothetical protein